MKIAFFSAKKYDIASFERAAAALPALHLTFLESELTLATTVLAADHDAVCAFVNDELHSDVLQDLSKRGVKAIALRCAGFDNVDLKKAGELGIKVVRVPAYSPEAVAEYAVGLILTVVRKYHKSYARTRDGNFTLSGLEGFTLHGKTVGIVGTGRIGLHTARILALGFGCTVIAFDPQPNEEGARAAGITYVQTLEDLLARADIVSLHCPLAPGTRGMMNAAAFARMKRGAVFINTSRGALVDSRALIGALKSAHLAGVGLDVYDGEEGYFFRDASDTLIQDDLLSRLLSFHNVFISGHQAFLTEEALSAIAETTLDNLARLDRGENCANEVKE